MNLARPDGAAPSRRFPSAKVLRPGYLHGPASSRARRFEGVLPMTDFTPRPIQNVAHEPGLTDDDIEIFGRGKAKIELEALERKSRSTAKGRLILVTAINPTPAGEGKTTTSIGLAMGMRRLGKAAVLALREPSLGPVFGVKGGGTGGGKASLVPADDINLHFTGDIHAITTAHNLLSALL